MALTEYWRRYFKNYLRKYRKNNRERIREIRRKSDLKHKEKHYSDIKAYKENNREKVNKYYRDLYSENKEYLLIIKERHKITERNKLAKMSLPKKIDINLNKILKDIEFSNLVGATDLDYQEQIKLRIDTCKILIKRWKEDTDLLEGKE